MGRLTERQASAPAFTIAAVPFVARPTLRCPACFRMMAKPYGGPADQTGDGTDPCERCVLLSFTEHG